MKEKLQIVFWKSELPLMGIFPDKNEIVYSNDEYYISYNPKTFDEGKQETAICLRDPWKCLILYGDHREGYKPIAEDLMACKKYWLEHKDEQGSCSDGLDKDDPVLNRFMSIAA